MQKISNTHCQKHEKPARNMIQIELLGARGRKHFNLVRATSAPYFSSQLLLISENKELCTEDEGGRC